MTTDALSEAMPTQDARTTLAGPAGDRCPNCQAPLASDQRYCINCGVRRGKSRFSLDAMAAQAAPPVAPPSVPRRPVRSRMSSGLTLVTGVATLLLAMGVGVLIGHDSSSSAPQRASAPVQVVTVGSGGGSVASTARVKTKKKSSSAKTAKQVGVKPTVVHLNKKTVQQAQQAATKVFGKQGNLAPATVQVGGACSHGAGCQGGKFTGNFFH